MKEIHNWDLFEFITSACFGEGGDGDVTVFFEIQNLETVAQEFEFYLRAKGWGSIKIISQNNEEVYFSESNVCQESFIFKKWTRNYCLIDCSRYMFFLKVL